MPFSLAFLNVDSAPLGRALSLHMQGTIRMIN
jgi:hypothetical protein